MKAAIVDDEVSAREILQNLLTRFFPEVEVVGLYANVPDAVQGINTHHPDVVFLDVEMPEYAGYEIVDFFDSIDFNIVFVTAYDKYAIQAFELSALDYLLKPIEIDRLKKAMEKLRQQKRIEQYEEKLQELAQDMRKSEHKISYLEKGYRNFILVNDIIALEAQRAYTQVHVKGGKSVIVSKNLKQLEEELSGVSSFYRTHRSWIINMDCFEKYSKSRLEIALTEGTIAKLSKQFKAEFEERIS